VFTASTGKILVVDIVTSRDGKDSLQGVENIRFGTETLTLANALVEPTDADNSAFQAYRFYNAETGSHFFTTSIAERNSVIETLDVLSYEGNAFDSNVTEANGTAVFRFFNTGNGVHFYTAAADEAASLRLNAGFLDEGISYYASTDASNGGTALFRFYNTQNDSHFYTVSEAERDNIISTIGHYNYEGVAFYVDAA
jgi:serralysin